jgi:hypothetical protein
VRAGSMAQHERYPHGVGAHARANPVEMRIKRDLPGSPILSRRSRAQGFAPDRRSRAR